jgi:DNA-binding response OmpR family regulator
MRLLLVEDDLQLVEELKQALMQAGFVVDTSNDGINGEFMGDTEPYDAIILDLGLPERPGLEVLQHWRERGNDVPVLILTARGAWHEKVDGFKAGADDYLSKPFHLEELVARIHALIRRRHGRADPVLSVAGLVLDAERQNVTLEDGNTIHLTATEYRLLEYLMHNSGKILSKTRLFEHAWSGDISGDENLIEVYINRLRRKIGADRIETRRGQGYIFRAAS